MNQLVKFIWRGREIEALKKKNPVDQLIEWYEKKTPPSIFLSYCPPSSSYEPPTKRVKTGAFSSSPVPLPSPSSSFSLLSCSQERSFTSLFNEAVNSFLSQDEEPDKLFLKERLWEGTLSRDLIRKLARAFSGDSFLQGLAFQEKPKRVGGLLEWFSKKEECSSPPTQTTPKSSFLLECTSKPIIVAPSTNLSSSAQLAFGGKPEFPGSSSHSSVSLDSQPPSTSYCFDLPSPLTQTVESPPVSPPTKRYSCKPVAPASTQVTRSLLMEITDKVKGEGTTPPFCFKGRPPLPFGECSPDSERQKLNRLLGPVLELLKKCTSSILKDPKGTVIRLSLEVEVTFEQTQSSRSKQKVVVSLSGKKGAEVSDIKVPPYRTVSKFDKEKIIYHLIYTQVTYPISTRAMQKVLLWGECPVTYQNVNDERRILEREVKEMFSIEVLVMSQNEIRSFRQWINQVPSSTQPRKNPGQTPSSAISSFSIEGRNQALNVDAMSTALEEGRLEQEREREREREREQEQEQEQDQELEYLQGFPDFFAMDCGELLNQDVVGVFESRFPSETKNVKSCYDCLLDADHLCHGFYYCVEHFQEHWNEMHEPDLRNTFNEVDFSLPPLFDPYYDPPSPSDFHSLSSSSSSSSSSLFSSSVPPSSSSSSPSLPSLSSLSSSFSSSSSSLPSSVGGSRDCCNEKVVGGPVENGYHFSTKIVERSKTQLNCFEDGEEGGGDGEEGGGDEEEKLKVDAAFLDPLKLVEPAIKSFLWDDYLVKVEKKMNKEKKRGKKEKKIKKASVCEIVLSGDGRDMRRQKGVLLSLKVSFFFFFSFLFFAFLSFFFFFFFLLPPPPFPPHNHAFSLGSLSRNKTK